MGVNNSNGDSPCAGDKLRTHPEAAIFESGFLASDRGHFTCEAWG